MTSAIVLLMVHVESPVVFFLGKLGLEKFKRGAECSAASGRLLWCWSGNHL